jgi:hypothetical protein
MVDETEDVRREMVKEINSQPRSRADLEREYGQVWDTGELSRDYVALAFAAPFVLVRRLSDGKKGSLMFQHEPRFYWGFRGGLR